MTRYAQKLVYIRYVNQQFLVKNTQRTKGKNTEEMELQIKYKITTSCVNKIHKNYRLRAKIKSKKSSKNSINKTLKEIRFYFLPHNKKSK